MNESADPDLADKVRERLALKRMSRQRLADEARISLSTLEKALSGARPFTLPTLVRLEQVLGVSLRAASTAMAAAVTGGGDTAPAHLGGYSRSSVAALEGEYLTLRPSFQTPGAVYAYRTVIAWDPAVPGLAFHEAGRLDAEFSQKGMVSAPLTSGHIYLHTNEGGQMRLAVLGRPLRGGEMYGLLATLLSGAGPQLTPAAAPIALIAMPQGAALGQIGSGHSDHGRYQAHLDKVTASGFARLFAGSYTG
jgi:transcriptional regulator with XRE-family HTH domain